LSARIRCTNWSVAVCSVAASTAPALVAIPGNRCASATWRALAAASSAFDGTQPVFTQVPPTVPRSIITTERPLPRAAIAAANPAAPDPMMARSTRIRMSSKQSCRAGDECGAGEAVSPARRVTAERGAPGWFSRA
jgi:hypothetical protein